MDILAMIKRVEAIDIPTVLADSITATIPELTRVQREQMLAGLNADGKIIGKYKSPAYRRKKMALNPLAKGNVDLRLKGQFQDDVIAIVNRNSITFTSNDNVPTGMGLGKTDKLVKQYGENIFGISVPYRLEYSNQFLKPEAVRRIKSKIYGK